MNTKTKTKSQLKADALMNDFIESLYRDGLMKPSKKTMTKSELNLQKKLKKEIRKNNQTL